MKLELGLTAIFTIGATMDFINKVPVKKIKIKEILPFFSSLSISSKSLQFNKVIFASVSTTIKS